MSGRWQLLERPENRPAATPEGGLRHAGTVTETRVFVPEYFCLDYRAAGLTPDPWFARNAAMVNTGAEQPAALDAEAREATRQRADDERVEAEKRERRNVLALNRLGDAAMMVRRRFVTRLLARKTPPKGAGLFVANCLGRDSYLLTNHNALTTTAELLGVDDAEAVAKLAADLPANGDGRAQVITLALVLGALEARTPKDAWRNATPSWSHHVGSTEYLRWLATDNNYPLAAVEEVITGAKTSEGVYAEYCRQRRQTLCGATHRTASLVEIDAGTARCSRAVNVICGRSAGCEHQLVQSQYRAPASP